MTGVSHADTQLGTASHSGRVRMARDTEPPGGGLPVTGPAHSCLRRGGCDRDTGLLLPRARPCLTCAPWRACLCLGLTPFLSKVSLSQEIIPVNPSLSLLFALPLPFLPCPSFLPLLPPHLSSHLPSEEDERKVLTELSEGKCGFAV